MNKKYIIVITLATLCLTAFVGCGKPCPQSFVDERTKLKNMADDIPKEMANIKTKAQGEAFVNKLRSTADSCFKFVNDHKSFNGCTISEGTWDSEVELKGCKDLKAAITQLEQLINALP